MMKILKKIAFLSLSLLTFFACDDDNKKPNYEGENRVITRFTSSNQTMASLIASEGNSVEVEVALTASLDKDFRFALNVSDDAKDYITISPMEQTIAKGEKVAKFTISSNGKAPEKDLSAKVQAKAIDALLSKMVISPEIFLQIKVPTENLNLTEKEKALIDSYKLNYSLDLIPLLGRYNANGKVIRYGEDKPNDAAPFIIKDEITEISLSPLATETKVILAMKTNAFGLANYFKTVYRGLTIDNKESWNHPDVPSSNTLMSKTNWTAEANDKYDVAYYTIEIDPRTKNIKEDILKNIIEITTLPTVDMLNKAEANANVETSFLIYSNADDLTEYKYMPFVFNFEPWERILKYMKENSNDEEMKAAIKEGSVSPYILLYNTTVHKDSWKEDEKNELSNYVKPTMSFDMNTKTIKVAFSVDNTSSAGYDKIEVTCKKI